MRCEHEHDDGAYVLGALSPAERAAYERHLATCSFCREAVADIAVLPGLLGRLDPADFAKLLDPTLSPPPPRAAPAAAPVSRRRKTFRIRLLSSALAVAVLALIVGVGVVFVSWDRTPGTTPPPVVAAGAVAMSPVDSAVPLTADIDLTGTPGGTKINLSCLYENTSAALKPYTVKLMVYGPDDEDEQLGSWIAAPGKEFTMSGVTHLTEGNLSRVELVRNDGKVLLAYDVP